MKTLSITFFILLLTLGVFAQSENNLQRDEIINASQQEMLEQLLKSEEYYNDSIVKYNWDSDSESFELYDKEAYTYHEDGNVASYCKYKWDNSLNSLSPQYKYTYYYNDHSQLYERYTFTWQPEQDDWGFLHKRSYHFDANLNMIEQYQYRWETSLSDWVYVSKYTYEYYNNGDSIVTLNYLISEDLSNWLLNNRIIETENTIEDTLINTINADYWNSDSNEFQPESKSIYTYVAENIVQKKWLYWDETLNDYYASNLSEYEYENSNLITRYQYGSTNQELVLEWRMNYFYNASNLKEMEIYTSFNEITFEVEDSVKSIFSYNSIDLVDTVTNYNWEYNSNEWLKYKNTVYLYDENDNLEVNEIFNFDQEINQWTPFTKRNYYWSMLTGGLFENCNYSIEIYPNPASNHLFIQTRYSNEIEYLYLTSTDGKQKYILGNKNAVIEKVIDISHIPSGTYVLNGIIGNDKFSKLIILEK
jgi:hypothetical protein